MEHRHSDQEIIRRLVLLEESFGDMKDACNKLDKGFGGLQLLMSERHHDIGRLEVLITKMDQKLFGNGKPGVLEKHDGRLTDLENLKLQILTVLTIAGTAITIIQFFVGVK